MQQRVKASRPSILAQTSGSRNINAPVQQEEDVIELHEAATDETDSSDSSDEDDNEDEDDGVKYTAVDVDSLPTVAKDDEVVARKLARVKSSKLVILSSFRSILLLILNLQERIKRNSIPWADTAWFS
jgi:hypothetical protein